MQLLRADTTQLPAPRPEPPGWDKLRIRCLSYQSQDLLAGTLADVLDENLGQLEPVTRRRIAQWMATLVQQGLKRIPEARGQLACVLKLVPVQLIVDRAVFQIVERDKPSPASSLLRYEGRGVRVAAPDLGFVDRALPLVPAPQRSFIKDLLRSAGLGTALPSPARQVPGPFQSFELPRPVRLHELAGKACTGVGNGTGPRVLAFTDGRLESSASSSAPSFAPTALCQRHRLAYGYAQQAELMLEEKALEALTFELLGVRDERELEQFLGKLARKVARAASNVAKAAASTARGVVKVAGSVGKAVAPIVGTVAKLASHSPIGSLARSTYGALSALARGENLLMGALDGLAGTPLMRGLVKMGGAVLRGENLLAAAKLAMQAGIADVREAARFAAMVAPFVPGIGTGIGAALGAANALASGRPISEAMVAAVRGSIPGGALAQAAFDVSTNLVKGQRIDRALVGAARNQLPPGPAQAAFDTGLAIAQGKKLQEAMLAGAGRLLPASPYAGDVMSFARRAIAGENLGRAALSTAGDAVLRRVEQQGGNLIRTAQGRALATAQGRLPGGVRRELLLQQHV